MTTKLKRIAQALEKNGMTCLLAGDAVEARDLALGLIKKEHIIGLGGSVTMDQIGILPYLKENGYRLLDRYDSALTGEERFALLRRSATADVFLCSTNAVTENGELVNKDGAGSRMGPVIFGPKKVILFCGRNKIVPDVQAALTRIEHHAAPLNAARLNQNVPCVKVGRCMDCSSDDRICCSTVILHQQRIPGRITVILIDEDLGY